MDASVFMKGVKPFKYFLSFIRECKENELALKGVNTHTLDFLVKDVLELLSGEGGRGWNIKRKFQRLKIPADFLNKSYIREWLAKPETKDGFIELQRSVSNGKKVEEVSNRLVDSIKADGANHQEAEGVVRAVHGYLSKVRSEKYNTDPMLFEMLKEGETPTVHHGISNSILLTSSKEVSNNDAPQSQQLDKIEERYQSRPDLGLEFLKEFKNDNFDTGSSFIKYKILLIEGNFYKALVQYEEAAHCYNEAGSYAKSEYKKLQLQAVAALFLGDKDKAKQCSRELIENESDDVLNYVVNFEASYHEYLDSYETAFPEVLHDCIECQIAISTAYWKAEEYEKSLHWATAAYQKDLNNFDAMELYGSVLLSVVVKSPRLVMLEKLTSEDIAQVRKAVEILKSLYEKLNGSALLVRYRAALINLISAYHVLEQHDLAAEMILALEPRFRDNLGFTKLKVHNLLKLKQIELAVSTIINFEKCDDELRMTLIEILLHQNRISEAGKYIYEISLSKLRSDFHPLLYHFKMEYLFFQNGSDAVIQFVENELPENISDELSVIVAKKLQQIGFSDKALTYVVDAYNRIEDLSFVTVVDLLDFFYAEKDYQKVVDICKHKVDLNRDSVFLFRYITSLFYLDKRREFITVISKIPSEIRKKKDYLKFLMYHHIKTGEEQELVKVAEEYFVEHGKDLDVLLNWAIAQDELGQRPRVKSELRGLEISSNEDPQLQMMFANLMKDCKLYGKAEKLAYAAFVQGESDNEIVEAYFMFMIGFGSSHNWDLDRVTKDSVIEYDQGGEVFKVAIVEDLEAPFIDSIASTTAFAQQLLGKKVGDRITVEAAFSPECLEIKSIHSFYKAAFHHASQLIARPDRSFKGVQVVQIPQKDGEFDVEGFFAKLSQMLPEKSQIDNVLSVYDEKKLPLGCLTAALGKDIYDVWNTFFADDSITIYSSQDEEMELTLDPAFLRDSKLLFDVPSLLLLFDLKLENKLFLSCNGVGVTNSTIQLLKRKLHDLNSNSCEANSLVYRIKWLEEHCEIVGSIPVEDVELPSNKLLTDLLDTVTVDILYASSHPEWMLMTDDMGLRFFSGSLFSKNSFWTYIVLKAMLEGNILSQNEFFDVTTSLLIHKVVSVPFVYKNFIRQLEIDTDEARDNFSALAKTFFELKCPYDVWSRSAINLVNLVAFCSKKKKKNPAYVPCEYYDILLKKYLEQDPDHVYERIVDFIMVGDKLFEEYKKEFLGNLLYWSKVNLFSISKLEECVNCRLKE